MNRNRLRKYRSNFPFLYRFLLARWFAVAKSAEFDAVETFVCFVGYPRSGHSLIGALLDAHPNFIVSHEASALELFRAGRDKNLVFGSILAKEKYFGRIGHRWSGYDYRVAGQYQGRYTDLKVIGDKKGGESSRLLAQDHGLFDTLAGLGCRIRMIHVVRNPLDNIVSRAAGGNARRREVTPKRLERATRKQLAAYRNNASILASSPFPVHTMYIEEFAAEPRRGLTELHGFLGTPANAEYLEHCARIVEPTLPARSDSVNWPKELLVAIEEAMAEHTFLGRYAPENHGNRSPAPA